MVAAEVVAHDQQTRRHLGEVVRREPELVDERIRRHEEQSRCKSPTRRPGLPARQRRPQGQRRAHVNQHVETHQARDPDRETGERAEPSRAG